MSGLEYFDELSHDNSVAFLQVESTIRNQFYGDGENDRISNVYAASRYVNQTIAAAIELEVNVISKISPKYDKEGVYESLAEIMRAVDALRIRVRIAESRRNTRMSVGLDAVQKKKIHVYINKIRDSVENSSASALKKDNLFRLLAQLAEEVDRPRTRFEKFGDLARQLAGVSNDFEETGVRPYWKYFAAIMGLVDDAKESEPRLPAPRTPKQIEPPPKQIEGPKTARSDIDDEIPF